MTNSPSRRTGALLIAGLWAVLAVVAAGQQVLLMQVEGRPMTIGTALLMQFPAWMFWALATPLILRLGLRPPLEAALTARRLLPQLALALVLSVTHSLLSAALNIGLLPGMSTPTSLRSMFLGYLNTRLVFDLLIYGAILGVGYAVEYRERFRARAIDAARLETELAQAELQALRSQLHPHFLFNTLNTIAVLTESDPTAAREMLVLLGDLLRATLEQAGAQEVRLRQELDFLRSYLAIEWTRFSDRLRVTFDLEPTTLEAWVPHLVLQPLVENAIRYAIAPRSSRGEITVGSTRVNGTLELRVVDDGPGVGRSAGKPGSGLGLSNTRARLERLYGAESCLTVLDGESGGTVVTVTLPWRAGAAPADGVDDGIGEGHAHG